MVERIAAEKYDEWKRSYYIDARRRMTLRLGQAFLNEHYPNVTSPTLFYCTDAHTADKMIRDEFVLPYQS